MGTPPPTPADRARTAPSEEKQKGFIASLFDLSFTSFVTPRIIKVVYVLLLLFGALYALAIPVSMFVQDQVVAGIVLLLVGSPLIFLMSVLGARIYLELVIVIFRAAEALIEVQKRGRKTSKSA